MYLRITVTPSGKKEFIKKMSSDKWQISVKEPAEQNLANTRVCTLVAREHGILTAQVRILTGHHSRTKIIVVDIETP